MINDPVLVVGGGIAGLTAADYLSQAGRAVLLCEKETKIGGWSIHLIIAALPLTAASGL